MSRTINNNDDFRPKRHAGQGFTIVELIVVIFLVVVFTTMVLLRQGSFQNSVLLRNTAYELALSIREAQVYGIGVRRDSADVVSGRYGVHIDIDTPELIVLYTDSDEDNMYGGGELKQTNLFKKPFSIVNICFTHASGVEECADSVPSIIGLEILFIRPNPDAYLYLVRTGNIIESVSKARISIGAPNGKYIDVIISKTGQVAVQ